VVSPQFVFPSLSCVVFVTNVFLRIIIIFCDEFFKKKKFRFVFFVMKILLTMFKKNIHMFFVLTKLSQPNPISMGKRGARIDERTDAKTPKGPKIKRTSSSGASGKDAPSFCMHQKWYREKWVDSREATPTDGYLTEDNVFEGEEEASDLEALAHTQPCAPLSDQEALPDSCASPSIGVKDTTEDDVSRLVALQVPDYLKEATTKIKGMIEQTITKDCTAVEAIPGNLKLEDVPKSHFDILVFLFVLGSWDTEAVTKYCQPIVSLCNRFFDSLQEGVVSDNAHIVWAVSNCMAHLLTEVNTKLQNPESTQHAGPILKCMSQKRNALLLTCYRKVFAGFDFMIEALQYMWVGTLNQPRMSMTLGETFGKMLHGIPPDRAPFAMATSRDKEVKDFVSSLQSRKGSNLLKSYWVARILEQLRHSCSYAVWKDIVTPIWDLHYQ